MCGCLLCLCPLLTIHETQWPTRIQSFTTCSEIPYPFLQSLGTTRTWHYVGACVPDFSPHACLASTSASCVISLRFMGFCCPLHFPFCLTLILAISERTTSVCTCVNITLDHFFCLHTIKTRVVSKNDYCDQNPNKRGTQRGEGMEITGDEKEGFITSNRWNNNWISPGVREAPG